MNIYHRLTLILAVTLIMTGCSKDKALTENTGYAINYKVNFSSIGTKSSATVAEEGKLVLSDATATVAVPMTGEISGWFSDGCEVATKGQLVNATGSDDTPQNYGINSFFASVYNGTTPIYTEEEVTYSSSTSKWSTSDTYYWPAGMSLDFYAYANLPDESAYTSVEIAGTGVSLSGYSVPEAASEQNDILLGTYQGYGFGSGTAEIRFEHPLTAVRFLYGEIEGNPGIKSISLEGVAASGTVTMNAEGDIEWSNVSSYGKTVTLEGASPLDVDDDTNLIGEPFIIIPQDLGEHNVTVTVTLDDDTVIEAVVSTGEWVQGHTNTYTLGYASPCEILTVTGDVSMDYDATVGSNTYSVTSGSPWKLQYTTDGGSSWTDATANTAIDGWISFDKVSGTGSADAQTVTATVTAASSPTTYTVDHNVILRNALPKGTASAPYDLSMHTIYGEERASGHPVTANSYVVNASGWYAFPLVYGNAIDYTKNSVDGNNTGAYNPSGTSSDTFLKPFKSATGDITSPFITGAAIAYPLWEDVANYALISNATTDCYLVSSEDATSMGLTLGGRCGYVVFHVNRETLTQGNAVIAVSDGTDILWSWHIWVTDNNLSCKTVTNKTSSPTFNKGMLPLNLGWVDLGSEKAGYEGKSLQIRFVQMNGNTVMAEVGKIAVRKEYATISAPDGQCPTYQWGRKDPFIRSASMIENFTGEEMSGSQYSGTFIDLSQTTTTLTSSESIKHPTQFAGSSGWNHYLTGGGGQYNNLWSAENATIGPTAAGYDEAPVKTVYDPCPPGFQVPQADAFTAFTASGGNATTPTEFNVSGEFSGGYNFYSQPNKSGDTMFFPAVGYRNDIDGQIYFPGLIAYYWCAVPHETEYCYKLDITYYSVNPASHGVRSMGNPIRPVEE